MPMHLLHLQSDDNDHGASSASPAVMIILVTTRPLHHQRCLTPQLKCIERDGDDYDDDDDDDIDDEGNVHIGRLCWLTAGVETGSSGVSRKPWRAWRALRTVFFFHRRVGSSLCPRPYGGYNEANGTICAYWEAV